jgi:hypothetical protein
MRHELLKNLIPIFLFALILTIASNSVLAQTEEKTFTNAKFRLNMKYPADWSFISAGDPSPGVYSADFCPSTYLESEPNVLSCPIESPVSLGINVYNLTDGATLKEFYDQQIAKIEQVTRLVGPSKNIETKNIKISGLSAIQTLRTHSDNGGSLGKLLKEVGQEPPTRKDVIAYVVNGSTGYQISGGTKDEKDFDTYLLTIQKMINSFQIQGVKENSDNISFVPETKSSTEDVVLLSQRLKKGDGDYNHIVGQVKNIGLGTVKFVKIGLTVYDKNRDVVGTDSTYAETTTLEPNQKSSFDIFSNKVIDGMESYELLLQWKGSDGRDQNVENASIYKMN